MHKYLRIVDLSLVSYKILIDNDSQILVQIYKCLLEYSVRRLGFVYGVEQVQGSSFAIEKDSGFMLYFLQEELLKTFSDYKKTLIKHLISIIKSAKGATQGKGFSVSDKEFEYVFETVVNSVFGTEKPKSFYTHATYVISDKQINATKQRPDTVMKRENGDYYIIDSKYYNYGYVEKSKRNPRELPESSSVIKQIAYNTYHSQENGTVFRSIFLLPYASNEHFEYIGYAYAQQDKESLSDEEKVAVCLVDLKTLVDIYLTSNEAEKTKLRKELTALVEKECFN